MSKISVLGLGAMGSRMAAHLVKAGHDFLRLVSCSKEGRNWPRRLAHVSLQSSTLLHALGVDLKVQQELLRQANVRTTMNIYTQAVPNALRKANSKVVRLILPAQVA